MIYHCKLSLVCLPDTLTTSTDTHSVQGKLFITREGGVGLSLEGLGFSSNKGVFTYFPLVIGVLIGFSLY